MIDRDHFRPTEGEETHRMSGVERIAATLSTMRRACSRPQGAIPLALVLTGTALVFRSLQTMPLPRWGGLHLAVAIAALLGGLPAGLTTIALSVPAMLYWFYPRVDGTIAIAGGDLQALVFFVVTGLVISVAVDLDRLRHDLAGRRARTDLARAEARVRSVIRTMREGVLVLATDGRPIFANPAAEEFLASLSPAGDERHGAFSRMGLIDEDGHPIDPGELPGARVLATGRPARDVVVGIGGNDETVWLLINAEPIRDPETEELLGAVMALTDVSGRRRFEHDLLESRARLDAVVSLAADAIVAADETGSIVLFNPAAERMFGLCREEALGRPLEEFLPRNATATADDPPFAAPDVPERTLTARRRDGSEFVVEASFSRADDGTRPLLTAILRDATERRLAAERDGRLAAIVAFSPAAIVAFGRDERISAWNPAAVRMFGHPAATALGAAADLIAFPADAETVHANIRRTLAGETISGEAVRRRADGTPIEVALHTAPVRRADGEVSGASVMFFEIGEGRRIERLLREREDEQRQTLAAAGLGVWWIEEPSGRVECDPRSAELFGTSATPTVAEIARRFAPEPPPFFASSPACAAIDPEPVVAAVERPDGTSTWLSLTARRRVSADGVPEIWGTVRDVGAQVLAERAMQQIEASRRLEALGRMTGGIAHDFNNLLTVVSGNLQLLELRPLDETCRRRVEAALQATESGAALVKRLSTFARQRRLEPAVVDLNTRIAATMDLARRSIGASVTLVAGLAPEPWPVRVDVAEFESALLNLVFNARDAIRDGGTVLIETCNVEVDRDVLPEGEAPTVGPFVRLSVCDDGIGMTPEVRARAFEPFFTTKEVGRGTGLGLAMLHGFVHQSGGFVTLYSEPGRGTTVNVYLPRTEVEGAPIPEPAPAPPIRHGRGERILVVEDHADVATITRERLIAFGYAVVEAATGPQALALVEAGEPIDLVFSDVVMPGGMSGLDLAHRLREERPDLPVLLTSGFAEDLVRAGDPTADRWTVLRKPYSQADLARAVGATLAPSRADAAAPPAIG